MHVTGGLKQVELTGPENALNSAGAESRIVSRNDDRVSRRNAADCGANLPADLKLAVPAPKDFAALLLLGNVINSDALQTEPSTVAFAEAVLNLGKPVASMCHRPGTIIDTGAKRERLLPKWPPLQSDVKAAGADWVDERVSVDRHLVTSRKPAHLPAFDARMTAPFGQPKIPGCTAQRLLAAVAALLASSP